MRIAYPGNLATYDLLAAERVLFTSAALDLLTGEATQVERSNDREPEPEAGPEEAHQLGDELLALRGEFELSILMIEHHVPLVLRACDYVYVLNFGQLLTEGLPHDVRNHPEVVAAYLGEEAPLAEAEAEAAEATR